ncbi:hypothetical protein LNQ49_04675 [Flavobacterium sp. F-65]|uniref:Lipoprotein n=1 Tax=Flavobacterium pisciphilum TaxID=2893755 RepID=A0ABS8MQ73_9FLAO|nr:hypothetical protein [Flavobacterium sp. F-65]MCC9070891.1 hypothetical protein [Flavobacterium sp. F-65]
MIKNNLLLLLLLLLLTSCNKTFDNQEEMYDYIKDEDNGYCYKKTVNGVDYILQYRPTDLLVQQDLENKTNPTEINRLRQKYNKYLYFNLSMSKNNQELLNGVARDKTKFGQMVTDLAFRMEEKLHVYTPTKDTLALADFIYPRMYGMSSSTSIMIVYPRDNKFIKQDYLNFVIEDLGLDTGDIKFKINTKALEKEPQLRF